MIRLLLATVAIVATLALISHGLTANEKQECIQWKIDSIEYASNWYATPWQVEQCKQFNIAL